MLVLRIFMMVFFGRLCHPGQHNRPSYSLLQAGARSKQSRILEGGQHRHAPGQQITVSVQFNYVKVGNKDILSGTMSSHATFCPLMTRKWSVSC